MSQDHIDTATVWAIELYEQPFEVIKSDAFVKFPGKLIF
jgi:hypothetical protein